MSTVDAQAQADASKERTKVRSFEHGEFSLQRVAAARAQSGLSVSVCLPARECASTVGQIVQALEPLREAGAIDQLMVLDAASADGTALVAARAGAEVCQEAELMPEYGPVLGKGDAMWRALTVLDGDLICFLDADSERFSAHFATGLLGPLLCEREVSFVKAFYRRPLLAPAQGSTSSSESSEGGGRVNHLTARPALALFYPPLAQIRQPLAGEVAARRELLRRLPFATGYGVEVAMLIDAWHAVGLRGIAQVDLDQHFNRHQPLAALAPMALTVLATIARRLEQEGRLAPGALGECAGAELDGVALDPVAAHAPLERPPIAHVLGRSQAPGVGQGG
jgi:glucosyl-3-phosphoglycerate synthase